MGKYQTAQGGPIISLVQAREERPARFSEEV